jgi:hypothetical protein
MADLNMRDFNKRLKRIDRIHKAGGAFEASGAIGRAFYTSMARPRRRSASWLKPLAIVLAGVLLFKIAVYGQLGAATYDARIALLADGSSLDKVGAWMMTVDPVTQKLGDTIRTLVY